jgi:hypothetical protein
MVLSISYCKNPMFVKELRSPKVPFFCEYMVLRYVTTQFVLSGCARSSLKKNQRQLRRQTIVTSIFLPTFQGDLIPPLGRLTYKIFKLFESQMPSNN